MYVIVELICSWGRLLFLLLPVKIEMSSFEKDMK